MIKLITGFSDYSADDLAHLGDKVTANLPGIPVFSGLKPTILEITAAVNDLKAATALPAGPSRAQAVAAAFDALAGLLGEIATNAPQVANVTDTDLAGIGLPIAKTPTRSTTPPPQVQNLRLQHGDNPGEVTGKCDALGDNIRLYDIQWTLDPNAGPWVDGPSSPNSRAFKLTSLARGKDIWARVRARNTVGPGPWSDPATIMVT